MAHASRSQKREAKSDTTLSAAAFQDHIVKSLNFCSISGVRKNLNHPLPVKKKNIRKNKVIKRQTQFPSGERNDNKFCLLINKCLSAPEYVIKDDEITLRNKSLAERFGILENQADYSGLSERQWDILKRKAHLRTDLSSPCSICKEVYTIFREQVLLSCSHSFHRKCLDFFEKFSGKKSCPLCRKDQYEKRVIYDGARDVMISSAIKIQSQWRRFIARIKYIEMIKDKVPSNLILRRKFYKSKFLNISDQILEKYENHNGDVSELLETIDNNIAINKSVMNSFEHMHLEKNWDKVQIKAIERENNECPICLGGLNAKHHNLVLLSCSHMFHNHCLLSYEEYCEDTNTACPLCRTSYVKRNCSYTS